MAQQTPIHIIQNVHPMCSRLDIKSQDELLRVMWALNVVGVQSITKRIFDPSFDSDNFVEFISSIKMFGLESKGEIKKLIKNNGLKINNKLPCEKITDIEWIRLNKVEFAIVKKGKNDFDFIFKEFILC